MSSLHPEPSPLAGRRLSRLLERWADARRLDARQAESIRHAVHRAVQTGPADLGFDWWWRLLDPDNGSVFRSSAGPSPSQVFPVPSAAEPFATLLPDPTSWAQDDDEYQPYLRLA